MFSLPWLKDIVCSFDADACLSYENVVNNRSRVWQIGAPFDYNIHNAIMRENTNEFDEDVVCKVRFFTA